MYAWTACKPYTGFLNNTTNPYHMEQLQLIESAEGITTLMQNGISKKCPFAPVTPVIDNGKILGTIEKSCCSACPLFEVVKNKVEDYSVSLKCKDVFLPTSKPVKEHIVKANGNLGIIH